jgi:hypothetical protein
MRPGDVLTATRRYLRSHPEEFSRLIRNAIGLRFGVPLAAFRWLAAQLASGDQVEDVEIGAVPPGLRMAATVDLMKTRVRAGAVLYIDRIYLTGDEMRVELRLEDVSLIPVDTKKSQIAALLVTRSLDLSRPGDLVQHLPDMPDMIVDSDPRRPRDPRPARRAPAMVVARADPPADLRSARVDGVAAARAVG